jgi:adenylosuccinate synthase
LILERDPFGSERHFPRQTVLPPNNNNNNNNNNINININIYINININININNYEERQKLNCNKETTQNGIGAATFTVQK